MNTHQRLLSGLALSVALAALLAITFARPALAESAAGAPDGLANLPVAFSDCVESIGVTLVPTASARVYVPHQFSLAGEGQPVVAQHLGKRFRITRQLTGLGEPHHAVCLAHLWHGGETARGGTLLPA